DDAPASAQTPAADRTRTPPTAAPASPSRPCRTRARQDRRARYGSRRPGPARSRQRVLCQIAQGLDEARLLLAQRGVQVTSAAATRSAEEEDVAQRATAPVLIR